MKKHLLYLIIFISTFFLLDYVVHSFLEKGLHNYFGIGKTNEIALIGHSHLMLGINKSKLEEKIGKPISKYTSEGVNVSDRKLMINYLLENNPNIKYIVYGVDAWMFTGEGLSKNSYKLFLPFMDDQSINKEIKNQAPFDEYLQKNIIRTSRYTETLINSSLRGHLSNWSNLKIGIVDTLKLKQNIINGDFRKINSTLENKKIFEETIALLNKKNIKVILVYVPTISYYNKGEPQKFNDELNYFRQLNNNNPMVEYLEYIEIWENKYNYFFDPIHLNPQGQEAFTNAFSTDLKKIIQ